MASTIVHEQRFNGWYCRQSPTGRWVAHGNCTTFVYDTVSGATIELPHLLPWTPTPEDAGGQGAMWPVGWISDDELVVTTQMAAANNRRADVYHARTGQFRELGIPTEQCPGYGGGAGKGHLVSSVPGPWLGSPVPDKFFVFSDGVDVTPTEHVAYGPALFDGTHYLYRIPVVDGYGHWPSVIRHIDDHRIVAQYNCPPQDWRWGEFVFTDLQGQAYSLSTCKGRALLRLPDGTDLYGPAGESHAGMSFHPEEILVWTIQFEDELTPVLLGRRLADFVLENGPALIVKKVWQCDVSVRVLPDGNYQLCGYNGGGTPGIPAGTCTVGRVPISDARVVYVPPTIEEPVPESVIPPQRPAWIVDTEGILMPRGNGISTSDGTGPARFEDAEWVEPAWEKDLESLYFGPEPCRRYPDGSQRTKLEHAFYTSAMAIRNGVPVQLCDEFGDHATAEWMEWFAQNGTRVTWMVEAYTVPTESSETYRAKTKARLNAHRPVSVVAPYADHLGGGSEAENIRRLNILREELDLLPEPPQVIDLFGLRRDLGADAREEDGTKWIAATPRRPTLRKEPVAPVDPVDPVEPERPPVIIVVPKPKPGIDWGKIFAIFKLWGKKRGPGKKR